MTPDASRLVLGTAQLGLHYGISNRTGMPSQVAATQIVRAAWEGGINTFDTAHAYGRSQEVLGRALADIGVKDQARVVSKFPVDQPLDPDGVFNAVHDILVILGIPCLEAMLFHRDVVVESWDRIYDSLEALRAEGLVRSFGVSTYEPMRALAALECDGLNVLQVPGNLLDRRFDSAGFMHAAVTRGVTVYLRSVFLQGLLLMDPDALPAKVRFARDAVRRIAVAADEYGLDRDELALCYARDRWPHAKILVGAETPEQVRRNVEIWKRPALEKSRLQDVEKCVGEVDERVVRPDRW